MRDNKTLYTVVVLVVILLIELKLEIITNIFGIQLSNLKEDALDIFTILYNSFLAIVSLLFLHGSEPKNLLKEIGAYKKHTKPIVILVLVIAIIIIFTMIGSFCKCEDLTLLSSIIVICFAVENEIVFRGFILTQLFHKAKWGFLPALSIYPILFWLNDLLHFTHFLNSLMQLGYLLLFTLWLSWIFIEWNDNIWIAIILNLGFRFIAFMGGAQFAELNSDFISVYVLQLVLVAFSVFFTIKYAHRKSRRFRISKKNLFLHPYCTIKNNSTLIL